MYGRPPHPRMMRPGFRGPPPFGFRGPPPGPHGPFMHAPGPMWYPPAPMPSMYPEPPVGPTVPWSPVPGVPYNPQKYMSEQPKPLQTKSVQPKPPGTTKLEKKVKVGSVSASPVGTILNRLKTDVVRCDICKVDCKGQLEYDKHVTEQLHQERVAFRQRLNKSKIEQAKAALLDKVSSGQIDLSKAKSKLTKTGDNKDKAADDKDTEKKDTEENNSAASTTEAGKGGDKTGGKIPINIKFKGIQKKKEEEKPKVAKPCEICNIQLPSVEEYNKHVQTLMHENKVASKKREESRSSEKSRGRARSQERSRGHERLRGRDRSRERPRGRDRSSERARGRDRSRERHRSDYSPNRGMGRRAGRYPENPGRGSDDVNGERRSSTSDRSPSRRSPGRRSPHSQPALLPTPMSVVPQHEKVSRFSDNSGYSTAAGNNYRPPLLKDPEPPVNPASRAPIPANPVMHRTGPALADDKEYCTVCNIAMPNHEAFVKHIGGILHREKVAASRGQKPREGPKSTASGREYARNFVGFYETLTTQSGPNAGQGVQASRYCALCDVPFQSEETYNRHLRGLMHIQKMKAAGTEEPKPEAERKRKLEAQNSKLACEICGIECFSMNTYTSHMERTHNKKTLLPTPVDGGAPASAPPLEPPGRPSSLTPFLQQTHQAVIGLSYIREYQHPSQDKLSTFECDLCSDTFTYNTVPDHLVTTKHRLLYFERHHPDIATELRRQPQSLEFYSHDIEARSGRGSVQVIPAQSAPTDAKKSRFDVNNTALLGQPSPMGQPAYAGQSANVGQSTYFAQAVPSGYNTDMTPTIAAPARQWETPQQAAATPALQVETPQLSEAERLLKLTQMLGATSALTAPVSSLQTETPDVDRISSNARSIQQENDILAAILAFATNKGNANAAPVMATDLTTPLTTDLATPLTRGLSTSLAAPPRKTGNEEYDPFEATSPETSTYQSTNYGSYTQHGNYAATQGSYGQPAPVSYGGYDNRAPVGGVAQPVADTQGPLGNVLSTMAGCMVSNEDDAAVALQVSNTLTQALLQYKLQNNQATATGSAGIPDYAALSERIRHLHDS